MKGHKQQAMALKTYNLTIVYDDETDEVEYIQEELTGEEVTLTTVGSVDIAEYFTDDIIELLVDCTEIGES